MNSKNCLMQMLGFVSFACLLPLPSFAAAPEHETTNTRKFCYEDSGNVGRGSYEKFLPWFEQEMHIKGLKKCSKTPEATHGFYFKALTSVRVNEEMNSRDYALLNSMTDHLETIYYIGLYGCNILGYCPRFEEPTIPSQHVHNASRIITHSSFVLFTAKEFNNPRNEEAIGHLKTLIGRQGESDEVCICHPKSQDAIETKWERIKSRVDQLCESEKNRIADLVEASLKGLQEH